MQPSSHREVTGVTYLFAGGTAIGTFWNAVVSLGENRDSGYLWTGIWYHHLFPEVGYQLQFWCNLIQGPHLQQFCLELLVAAIHNRYIYLESPLPFVFGVVCKTPLFWVRLILFGVVSCKKDLLSSKQVLAIYTKHY